MATITRKALRVYAALRTLQPGSRDVLDALLPFFEPILGAMDGKVFSPNLFALAVKRVYRWRFNADIAEQLIPRLVRAGYLEQVPNRAGIFLVKFSPATTNADDAEVFTTELSVVVDEFEVFPPKVSDLLNYSRTRDELTDILVRFLVSLDVYSPSLLTREFIDEQPSSDRTFLLELEEGGQPLPSDDRYMAARFVESICNSKPHLIPTLARLASIGLLTEVVDDFVRPTDRAERVTLTLIVDAPLALDYLGCSGTKTKEDVRSIFESLRGIGCSFVVFPVTCLEMRRNLETMLRRSPSARHGPTHDAIVRREVMIEYVQRVASDPDGALKQAGIIVRQIELEQYPNTHKFFSRELYEDFFSQILWVSDVEPREHDAACLALTMRLREGKSKSDIFGCRYAFITRNPAFVRLSRAYCLQNHLLTTVQEGPIVHQRELAMIAWLRTGLGAAGQIPRTHLLATCDRILRLRPEVQLAVADKLSEFSPDKREQFELLIQDHRSLRRLADETLNNETIVTGENAEALLEAMRLATIADEKRKFDEALKENRKRANIRLNEQRILAEQERVATVRAREDRDALRRELDSLQSERLRNVRNIASITSRTVFIWTSLSTCAVFTLAGLSVLNYFTGWLSEYKLWSVGMAAIFGVFGLYNTILNALERPKPGLKSVSSLVARKLFNSRISLAGLSSAVHAERIKINGSQIDVPDDAVV